MKVALLTFHNALNYGASLQVYASQQAIQNLGFECDIINYVNEYRNNAYKMSHHVKDSFKKKNLKAAVKYSAGSAFMQQRRVNFKKFQDGHLKHTEQVLTTNEQLKSLNNKYDKFIIGSDQVWNFENNGNDFSYFLNFVEDNKKKIAYSSSFGLSTIPEELKDEYKKNLLEIKHLSTREAHGVKLIKELTGRDAELVLDPVFLLNKHTWETLLTKKNSRGKYVFAYTNKASQFEQFLATTKYDMSNKKLHKLTRHVTVNDFVNPKVKVAYSISPMEFLETIANAELVVTASFHCIALSLILNIPFVAILSGDKGKDERVLNILKITRLENRILEKDMKIEDVNKRIDFDKVNRVLEEYKMNSLGFLKDAILADKL